jgi:aminotransferase
MDRISRIFAYQKPNSAYFVFPAFNGFSDGSPRKSSWDFALELLDKAKVAVVPGVAFGPNGEHHVRMSFGRSEEDINITFDRLEDFFR